MDAIRLQEFISFVIQAHSEGRTKEPTRRWDKKTPYGIHPVFCGIAILHETNLPEKIRENGAIALFLHDIIEDTTANLPEWIPREARELVIEMTFTSSQEEFEKIWERSSECWLLKLYDKTSNLMDGAWMPDEKWNRYCDLVHRLIEFVEEKYGELNITKIARAITKRRPA